MRDSAGHDNNGKITSVETGVPGLAGGNAYRFDGPSSYVVPDDDALDPASATIKVTANVKVANGRITDDSYEWRVRDSSAPGAVTGRWRSSKEDPTTRLDDCTVSSKGSSPAGRARW